MNLMHSILPAVVQFTREQIHFDRILILICTYLLHCRSKVILAQRRQCLKSDIDNQCTIRI